MSINELQTLLKQRKFDELHAKSKELLSKKDLSDHEKKVVLHMDGMAFYYQNDLGQSIDCFKTALELDPKFTDAAITLSVIYNDIGKYDEAKKIYSLANQSLGLKRQGDDNELDRKFALKHIELGDLYFKYHRYDEALEDYSKALRLDPNQTDYRIKIAKVYAKKGYTTRAMQELQRICNEQPTNVVARNHLGLMYFSQGNVIEAEQEWETALEIDPGNQEILTYLDMAKKATETNA
jgi:tetratricopeptide (TPR) repeat protein